MIVEREKKEQAAKREYEGRLIKQLLEERRQWQTTVEKTKKAKDCDTARIIRSLQDNSVEDGSCRGQQQKMISMPGIGIIELSERLKERYRE